MSKEFLKMQKLAGLITENQYKGTLTEIEGDPDDYYGYNEPINPKDYADGNPSDAIIYDALLDMNHEQLVSDMLSTAESNPSITLVKYLDKYDSSNDLNEGADGYDDEDEFDLNAAMKASPERHSYDEILEVIKSYEDKNMLNDFINEFPQGKGISRNDYEQFCMQYVDDMSEQQYVQANWISITDPDIYEKAGLV
jgi:hypothetical protein